MFFRPTIFDLVYIHMPLQTRVKPLQIKDAQSRSHFNLGLGDIGV